MVLAVPGRTGDQPLSAWWRWSHAKAEYIFNGLCLFLVCREVLGKASRVWLKRKLCPNCTSLPGSVRDALPGPPEWTLPGWGPTLWPKSPRAKAGHCMQFQHPHQLRTSHFQWFGLLYLQDGHCMQGGGDQSNGEQVWAAKVDISSPALEGRHEWLGSSFRK